MTSTNDGKDVKSNQTSGHKSKSYYIELYTSLEKALSGDGSLEERTTHVCEAWRRVYSLYQHSASSTHPHLLSWLQRHTANTVLQSKWAKSKNEHARLTEAIDALVAEATAAAAGRELHPWETLLLQRAAWFRKAVENPWDNEVLKSLINPNSEPVTDQQVLEWLVSEHGVVLVTRLQRMAGAGNCDDLALLLASAVMDRARAAIQPRNDEQPSDGALEEAHKSFVAVLERDASFTAEEWEMLTDIELVLLLKTDKQPRCIELAKLLPLRHGYKMVERLRKRLEMSPRDKKLWKHAKEVAKIVAQVMIARCMVVPACAGAGRDALYWCARALARLVAGAALRTVSTAMAALAATARHLHTFCAALSAECKELKTDVIMKPFICELYVRAITAGMNELAQLKLNAEKESEARMYEQTLAGWFTQLGGRLTDSARLRAECALTAFSVHPARKHYERVANTPPPPRLQPAQEPTPETTSEYGSWANDSRTQSNLVKNSETLQLKQSQQHQANVLSTAILTEGEALGLETVLCNDLAVLLSGPRVKTLSWDMDREVLLENCRAYMEKTHGGTRAVTTELKYLNLDPDEYRHLPEEGDDESDVFYGIEKGYEHEVQLEEPEDIWQNAFFDPEQTESAIDSEVESQSKKKTKTPSSEDDEDPLSNIAEAKREKKLAKEKRKEHRKKKSDKRDDSKDRSRERRKDKDKKTKKERKKDKSEQPTTGSLTSLLGMKVTKMSTQVQDGEKRVRKKKERRREAPATAMFSYVSVTDSDYDSQGKSSQEHDPNVLVDGVFSMDEIRSPERRLSIDNQKPIDNTKNTIKTSANVQSPVINDINTRPNTSSPLVSTTASEDSDASRAKSPYLTPNQLGNKHVINSKTKSKLNELIQFRLNKTHKNKSQVRDVARPPPSHTPTTPNHSLVGLKIYNADDVPKVNPNKKQSKHQETISKDSNNLPFEASRGTVNYDEIKSENLYNVQKSSQPQQHSNPMRHTPQNVSSESQKHVEYTQHSPIKPSQPMSHQSPSTFIQANYTSPSKTPDHMKTHPLNLTPTKPTISYQPFHKSMQNLSTESPKKPLLINDPNYFSQQHVKNAAQLSPRIISNTCIKPPSQTATNTQKYTTTVKNVIIKSPQTSNLQGPHTPRGTAQHPSSPIVNLNSDFTRYEQKQLSSSMQNINDLPRSYEVGKRHIPTPNDIHSQANAKLYSVISQSGTSNTSQSSHTNNSTASRCVPFQNQKVDTKSNKPDINTDFDEYLKDLVKKSMSASNGRDKNIAIALNKDVKMVPIPTTSVRNTTQCAKQLIQQKKTENAPNTFSRRSYMHKNKQSENKFNLTDTVTLELNRTIMDHKISKAKCVKNEVTISRVGPNTQEAGNVIRKPDQPSSKLQKNCPVLTSILDSSSPSKMQTSGNTDASHNTTSNQANREDADLLLLLRHQAILNHNVSNIPTSSDVTSNQTSNTQHTKVNTKVSSAHQTLVGTKVQNINILDNISPVKKESESLDWRRVMDAIKAQKTQSTLGPNALDLALNRDYRRHSQSSRGHSSDKPRMPGQSTLNKTSNLKKREHHSSKTSLTTRKPSTETHLEVPKKPREQEIMKKTQITDVMNKLEGHNKHFNSNVTKNVSQTSVIPNSDYDNLDDLLDDDLRRELGEISSDDDNYNTPTPMPKVKTHSNIPKTATNVYKAANVCKEKPHIIHPKTILHKNETNSSAVDSNRRIAGNTSTTSTTIGYPNAITNSSHPVVTHRENKPTVVSPQTTRHDPATTIITNRVAQDTANNIVTSHIEASHFISSVVPANVIIASVPVPQPPVVVIRQDLVYDPYPTIRIHESQVNAELCTTNQNVYAVNAAPNIAVFQTTHYAAPVINPIIIGNAMTTTNVSNATAMRKDHVAPDSVNEDGNKEDEDRISLETAIRLTDLEAEVNSQATDVSKQLDFNMNRNCERKVLSQVQEKHPTDNVDKDSHLPKSVDDSAYQTKEDEERIKLKRESLMNRKINHSGYHPPIPLTYAPLAKRKNLEKLMQQDFPRNGTIKLNLKSIPDCTNKTDKYAAVSTNTESPQTEANNENIDSNSQSSIAKGNQKCRRIWLRSSNKIRNKKSPVKRSRVPLRRNKLIESDNVTETVRDVKNDDKDIVKNPTRVSSRILNKVKLFTADTTTSPAQEETHENVSESNELIDFEEALSSSIVLKTPKTEVEIEKETKCYKIIDNTESEIEKSIDTVEQHKDLDSMDNNSKLIAEPNKTSDIRLEPKVLIEKLKSKLGEQIIIKRSSLKAAVKDVKVVALRNLKRAVPKNKPGTEKRQALKKESSITSRLRKVAVKTPSQTSTAIGSQRILDKSNTLLTSGIGDQKLSVETTKISAPLVHDKTNDTSPVINTDQKVITQSSTVSKIDELKPTAVDCQKIKETNKLAVRNVQKVSSSADSLSTIEENNKVKPIIVDEKVNIQATAVSPPRDKFRQSILPPVDGPKMIDQTTASELCLSEINTWKSPLLDDQEQKIQTVDIPRDFDVSMIDETYKREVKPIIGDEKEIIHTTPVSSLKDKSSQSILPPEDDQMTDQTAASKLCLGEINTLKSPILEDQEEKTQPVLMARDFDETNTPKSKASDQNLIEETGLTPDIMSATTEQKTNDTYSLGTIKYSSELEAKNNLPDTKATINNPLTKNLCDEKTSTNTFANLVIEKKENELLQCKTNTSEILSNTKDRSIVNAGFKKETDTKPTVMPSLQTCDILNTKRVQKDCEEIIDTPEVEGLAKTKNVQPEDEAVTNKNVRIDNCKSVFCQENVNEVVRDDIVSNFNDASKKPNVQKNFNEKFTNLREVNSIPNKLSDNDKRLEKLKALNASNDSNKYSSLTNTGNKNNRTYMKGDIKIEELPVIDSKDPLKKLVRITLPNGKVFRATIYGKIKGDFDSLFAEPIMRSILAASNINDGKRYTVNYKHVSKANKDNPNVILATEIHELNIKEAEQSSSPIDTVNLISDDEDEIPLSTRTFITEFGKYNTSVDEETFAMHQKKFNQKCEVRMHENRNDIFKSNRTKPKRKWPMGQRTLMTRNKSKLLPNAQPATDMIPEIIPKTDKTTLSVEKPIHSMKQGGGTISMPVVDPPNVIEIDDSSNDSIENQTPEKVTEPVKKIVELKDLLLQDLGVQTSNITAPLQKEKAVDNLKSALLLDLGIATQNPVIDITADDEKEVEQLTNFKKQNEQCDKNNVVDDTRQYYEKEDKLLNKLQEQNNLQKCFVKLVKCDNLIRKYESMKKCYVKLQRLNSSFPKAATTAILNQNTNNETTGELEETKNHQTNEMSLDAEDFIEFDVDEPSGSPQLSRCPSLSILNNWDDDSQPYLGSPYRSSPVMEMYDVIAQLHNKQGTEFVRKSKYTLSFTCDFEWTLTKPGYSIQEKLLRPPEIPTVENKIILPVCSNIIFSNPDNRIKLHYPPKLLTTTLEFLEKNPEVINQLKSMRRDRTLTAKTSPNKLKRKTKEVVPDTVDNKILKLGTLALNTLNPCFKALDAITVSNYKPNSTTLSDIQDSHLDENKTNLNAPSEESKKILSATVNAVPLKEDSKLCLEESDLIADSNMNSNETEDEYAELIQDSENIPPETQHETDLYVRGSNNNRCSNPTINNDTTDLYLEETMLIAVSVLSPSGNKHEDKCKDGPHCNQSGNEEIEFNDYYNKTPACNKTKEHSESELPNTCDNKTNATDSLALVENKEQCISPTLVTKETTANSDENVTIVESNTNPIGKTEENVEGDSQNSHDSDSVHSETDQSALCKDNQKSSSSTISDPLIFEESNVYSKNTVKSDGVTKDCDNVLDVMSKEQLEPARCELILATENDELKVQEEYTNISVNANLSLGPSIACSLSEVDSVDKHLNEKKVSPSPLSTETGDIERLLSVNDWNESAATKTLHKDNIQFDEILIDDFPNEVYEVEIVDTHIDSCVDIAETLNETSQEPITNEDVQEVNNHDLAIKSPVFIDTKKILFNYHDYTKLPKKKEDNRTNSINCRGENTVNTDRDLLSNDCGSKNHCNTVSLIEDSEENPHCEDAPTNHNEENCRLKSNPDCKYELIQEDDLLTVKITKENDKEDNETKTVYVNPNDAEEDTVIVAALCSNDVDDIDIKGYEFEDMYVFPLSQSASNSNTSNDSLGQELNSESVNNTVQDNLHDIDYHVIEPKITYSRKRKTSMRDIRVPAKKYRKGKSIDCPKQTVISMVELAYAKEYKRLLEYCSSVKFSYTRPFHKDCVEIEDLMSYWSTESVACDIPEDVGEDHLFVDLQPSRNYQPDPAAQTFVEEISYDYYNTDAIQEDQSNEACELNFNMGFGEGSGRVIQILKKGESNISAATLSDVKQAQPVLMSIKLDDCNSVTRNNDDQVKKIRQHVKFIGLRDKVRTFFKNLTLELKGDWLHTIKADSESKRDDRFLLEEFPYDLCSLDYIKPQSTDTIVQVVQVGQLPVSAAAQNPVTCDPRVTQVSDASPSQCSVDNSPNNDSQSEIKTEYTELTTADLTLPLQEYAQQNQASLASQDSNLELTEQTISLEMEIKAEGSPEIKEEMPDIKEEKSNSSDTDLHTLTNATPENVEYLFEKNTDKATGNSLCYDSSRQNNSESFPQQRQQNGTSEKTDQIAHAMNAAGITTTPETVTNTRAHALVNILSQKIRQGSINTTQTTTNTYSKTTSINALSLQQALAQILPPPLNQTGSSENNHAQSTPVGPQVLHIVQGKNASGNQITLVDNSQQSVISTPNATQVLHIVQNKNTTSGQASNGTLTPQANSFSGLSLVDAGLQQGGNQLLHIVNTGNQKNNPSQLLKRVNLLTNLTNVQGSNEQKMVQFVCKSADGKAIQLNAPHQRSMVLRLQPIEPPNVQTPSAKPAESQELSPSPTSSASAKESASQQEIKSRSIYEENYAKFIQNSSSKTPGLEKSTSLPKFNQAFGKPVFQEGSQKQGETTSNNSHMPPVNTNTENSECSATDNAINLEHIGQISSPPLLLRKQPVVTTQSQPNIVQQIKQTIAPMNIQTMHGGVIYTRQIPVNIGGGQTINLITVPSTELINDDTSKTQTQTNQGEIEPSIIKIVPQSQTTTNTESSQEESNNHASGSTENTPTPQPQPVLTQMRIKLPMLSKAPQMVPGARVVRPSFFQIQRNVIGGANQPVYQQLVLTAAPPLGQQTIRLPAAQASRPVKTPSESQSSSSESQMSTSTLEQLREFDMVLEQVKERSTVQPTTNTNNNSFKIHTSSSDTTDGNASSNCSTESTSQVLYSIGNNQSLNVAYVNRKTTVTTPTTSNYVRSPDSSGIADSPTSSNHVQIPQTVTTDSSPSDMSSQSKATKVSSKSKSRPKSTSNPPNTLKLNSVPPKTSSQKPLEDEQTTQRILYILAEYKEQVENSPDKDKPAPRRRSNPPSNPGSSKRKKSSSSRRSGTRDMSPVHGEDTCRTMGSEDSSCGTSQGDCTESCLDSHSPQDSPRKVARKITFDQDLTVTQPRPQPQRNVIVADGQTITVARGTTGKPATAVLMPANYILPVSMVKGGQQIAIVTNRGPKLLTVGGEGGATNALLLQRLIGPAGLKPVLARPGVRHVRLPTAALHNLQAFNLATATTVQPPDSTASPTPGPAPPELVDTRANSSPWTDRDEVKPERGSSPEGSEPWNLPSSADAHEYTYEETVRTDNMDRTVLVVQKKDGSQRQHRLAHVSAAALRHKYAILEHELRLQKSLSEECEDLGVDSPSASELFPEAELLFAASPAHEHNQEHHSHTPQPLQSSIPQPDMDDQIATDHLIPREIDVSLGLGDVGIVAVSEDGSATIALDQEEFARSHPNTTFHSEPTDGEVQPFTITGLKGRHITSTIFHSNSAPATVLMTAPQATVISQAPDHSVKYEIENMINSMPSSHNDVNLSSVLVKDDGLTRFDNILTDSRELHLTNTTSAIVHSSGNATQVIRRVCYEDDKRERDARYLIDEPDNLIAGDDAKMIAEDSSRDATLESMADVDDDRSSPERHAELFWESNSASERSESRRPLDFSSDSDKCCKSPSFDETNSTDSSGVGTHMRLDSVIKEARGRERSGSLDGSSADDVAPPLRTYPPKRPCAPLPLPLPHEPQRSLSGKTRAGERGAGAGADAHELRRRASGRGVVKRGCHCCNGEPAPSRPKKPRLRKPTLDFHAIN